MRVALAGQGAMGAALFDAVRDAGHEPVGILVSDRQRSVVRRLADWSDPVRHRARKHRIPALPVQRGGAWALRALKPDLLLCGDFGLILDEDWLSAPTIGAVNTHWSLLPRHRGPDPAAAAILAGDEETGLTFHVMTTRIDAGDILDQMRFPLQARDTTAKIYFRAAAHARDRLPALLERIAGDGLVGRAQDLAAGTYRRRIALSEAEIDWTASALEIDRLVRACTSPMAYFAHRGRKVYVSACAPCAGTGTPGDILSTDPLVVATGAGAIHLQRALTALPPFTWPGWPALRRGDAITAAV